MNENNKITKCPKCGSARIVKVGGCCGKKRKHKCRACGWKGD